MNDYEKDAILDKYISQLQHDLHNVKMLRKFLLLEDDSQYAQIIDSSIKLLEKKIDAIIHSKNIDEVKKHVKLKKLIKKFGDKI